MYSTREVQQMLGVSRETWKRRYNEILEYLGLYWDYDIVPKGRSNSFEVKEEYAPLEPLPRKTKSIEMKQFYKEETDKIVKYNPWNSGANIARQIIAKENKYEHKEGTATNYVRPVLKEGYVVSEDRKWMRLDYGRFKYEELSEEQVEYLKGLFTKYLGKVDIADILASEEAGYISKEMAYSQIKGNYNMAMEEFVDRYGFRPIKIGKYEAREGAFSCHE